MKRHDYEHHPCFNDQTRHQYGRIHLPVAARCNIQCNFCNRKYDCVNESRPGVTSTVLTPEEAINCLRTALQLRPNLAVVGIAGPGDPFANPEETIKTIEMVNENFPELLTCLATNGLSLLPYIDRIAQLQVSHVSLTINSVNPEIGEHIYAWVRDGKVIYRGLDAAKLLQDRQIAAIKELKKREIIVKVNTIIIPRINDQHIPEIAAEMKRLGVDIMNCIPIYPVPETIFAAVNPPTAAAVAQIREIAGFYLPQMAHCTRCRADAVGLLDEVNPQGFAELRSACLADQNVPPKTGIAIASYEGMLINQHLGEAQELFVFQRVDSGFEFLEKRPTPATGSGEQRWQELGENFADCEAILVSGVGDKPREVLKKKGIEVVETEGFIEEALRALFNREPLPRIHKKTHACGSNCRGNGLGCG